MNHKILKVKLFFIDISNITLYFILIFWNILHHIKTKTSNSTSIICKQKITKYSQYSKYFCKYSFTDKIYFLLQNKNISLICAVSIKCMLSNKKHFILKKSILNDISTKNTSGNVFFVLILYFNN